MGFWNGINNSIYTLETYLYQNGSNFKFLWFTEKKKDADVLAKMYAISKLKFRSISLRGVIVDELADEYSFIKHTNIQESKKSHSWVFLVWRIKSDRLIHHINTSV